MTSHCEDLDVEIDRMELDETDWLRLKAQLLLLRELVISVYGKEPDRQSVVTRVLALGDQVVTECVPGRSTAAMNVVRSEVLRLANDLRCAVA